MNRKQAAEAINRLMDIQDELNTQNNHLIGFYPEVWKEFVHTHWGRALYLAMNANGWDRTTAIKVVSNYKNHKDNKLA